MFTLADGRRRALVFETPPEDRFNITVLEANAAKIASPGIVAQGFLFGPEESTTFAQKALEVSGEVNALDQEKARVFMKLFRFFGEDGIADQELDWLFELMREPGNSIFMAVFDRAKPMSDPFAAGEEYQYIEFINHHPKPQEEMSGFMTADVKGEPQLWAFNRRLVAGTGG